MELRNKFQNKLEANCALTTSGDIKTAKGKLTDKVSLLPDSVRDETYFFHYLIGVNFKCVRKVSEYKLEIHVSITEDGSKLQRIK